MDPQMRQAIILKGLERAEQAALAELQTRIEKEGHPTEKARQLADQLSEFYWSDSNDEEFLSWYRSYQPISRSLKGHQEYFRLAAYVSTFRTAIQRVKDGNFASALQIVQHYLIRPSFFALSEHAVLGKKIHQGQRKGAHSRKDARGITALVERISRLNPSLTARQKWESIGHEGENVVGSDGIEYEVYRDGDLLIQRRYSDETARQIRYRTFQKYCTKASNALKSSESQ